MDKILGIHKHYELIDKYDNVLHEALTIRELSKITGISIKTLTGRVIKHAQGYTDCVVMEITYPIYQSDDIKDITSGEIHRKKNYGKANTIEMVKEYEQGCIINTANRRANFEN